MKKFFGKWLSLVFINVLLPFSLNLFANQSSSAFNKWWHKEITAIDLENYHIVIIVFIAIGCGLVGFFACRVLFEVKKKREKQQNSSIYKLQQEFRDIVDDIDYIQSIQLYSYRLETRGSEERICVKYLCGDCETDININAIQQEYYSIPIKLYKKYNEAAIKFNKFLSENTVGRLDDWNQYKTIAQRITEDLNKTMFNDNTVDDRKCCLYRLLRAQMSNMSITEPASILDYIFEEKYQEYELALLKHKRTGLLPSVFFDNSHFFRNISTSNKNGRVYMTCRFHDVEKHKRCILLVAFDGAIVSENKTTYDIEKDLKNAFGNVG